MSKNVTPTTASASSPPSCRYEYDRHKQQNIFLAPENGDTEEIEELVNPKPVLLLVHKELQEALCRVCSSKKSKHSMLDENAVLEQAGSKFVDPHSEKRTTDLILFNHTPSRSLDTREDEIGSAKGRTHQGSHV